MDRVAPRPTAASGWPSARLPILLLAALLGGCAINPPLRLGDQPAAPERLAGVPFFPQTEYQCGPAALAGVLGAAGVATDPEQLRPQVYLPQRQGSLQLELLAATRRAGRVPYLVERSPEGLFAELAAGRPVLVMQNLRTPGFPVWHYAVVVGQDRASNRVVLNSGTREGMRQRAPSFLRTWDWAQRWGMVALRPGELPASADPLRYAEAVAAFEAVAGGAAARPAWEAALLHWPKDHRAALALGNAAHAAGDPAAAIAFFEEGLARRPGDAVLANNLASLLGARGCPARGHALLAPVLAGLPEESPWRAALERTLEGLAGREDGPGCSD